MGINHSFLTNDANDESRYLKKVGRDMYCWVEPYALIYRQYGWDKVRTRKVVEYDDTIQCINLSMTTPTVLLSNGDLFHNNKRISNVKKITFDGTHTAILYKNGTIQTNDTIKDTADDVAISGEFLYTLNSDKIIKRPLFIPNKMLQTFQLNKPCLRIESFRDQVVAIYDDDRLLLG